VCKGGRLYQLLYHMLQDYEITYSANVAARHFPCWEERSLWSVHWKEAAVHLLADRLVDGRREVLIQRSSR
jgi:hypothetical protein